MYDLIVFTAVEYKCIKQQGGGGGGVKGLIFIIKISLLKSKVEKCNTCVSVCLTNQLQIISK